jgi:hypothetical protein
MASISRRLHKKSNDQKWHLIFIVSNGRTQRWDISSLVKLNKEFWTVTKRLSNRHENAQQLNFSLDLMENALQSRSMEMVKHKSLHYLAPSDVFFGRDQEILARRELIKQQPFHQRRLIS